MLFAITEAEAQRLYAARGDDAAVLHIVQEEIEQAWDAEHLAETDKAWDAIHRCLGQGEARSAWFGSFGSRLRRSLTMTGGSAPNDAARGFSDDALRLCILGGEQMHQGSDYIVSLLTPEQVKQVAEALRPIDKEWIRARYFKIDATDYGLPDGLSEQDFEYTWDWFEGVREFYWKAAEEGRWTIFTVDQ